MAFPTMSKAVETQRDICREYLHAKSESEKDFAEVDDKIQANIRLVDATNSLTQMVRHTKKKRCDAFGRRFYIDRTGMLHIVEQPSKYVGTAPYLLGRLFGK